MPTEKVQMPDGNGGYKEVDAERLDGQKADTDKQQQALEEKSTEAMWNRVAAATDNFNRYHKAYATDHNLTEEELGMAIYLEVLNWKEFYPRELGGPERYDELCKAVWDWFQAHK